jgi:hypothetical protein
MRRKEIQMKHLKQLLILFLGIVLGIVIARPFGAKAQDAKDPSHHEMGRITMTPISATPTGKVTLYATERYLGFSCTQTQCYVVTMD